MSSKGEKSAFPVVGIGASAGGLEALEELFEHLPVDLEMALIVIQHSDPSHETLLPQILSKHTKFPILLAEDGIGVKPGCAYVCPSGFLLELSEDTLHLLPRPEGREITLPIDRLLRSLATQHEERAIAVILSGSGSDGALGLQDVKANGGITFAQDEQTAKFYSMPHSAIFTGSVDFVLPPKQIAEELGKIARHEYINPPHSSAASDESEGAKEDLREILKLVHRGSGIDYSQYKYPTISRRVLRRMALHNLSSLKAYRTFLTGKPEELKSLAQDLLIQVTKFFRDAEVFILLKEKVFPAMTKDRAKEDPLRVWVPGCSSGEEIYSVLISLTEYLEESNQRFPIQAFGTDISEVALNKARMGAYIENIALDVEPGRLLRFFTKVGATYEINKSLRDLCVFAKHNILTDPPFGKLDLITCRNVLIYLEPALQKRVLSIFHYALKPTGILVLGNAESLGSSSDSFAPLDTKYRVFSKKQAANKMFFDFAGTQYAASRITVPATTPIGEDVSRGLQFQREADRILLSEFLPPGVIVDDKLDVIQFRGHTGAYLEHTPGFASVGLLKMLREGLLTDVKRAIDDAKKSKQRVRKEDLRVKSNGDFRRVAIEVIPAHLPPSGECFFLIVFEDMDVPEFKAWKLRRAVKDASRKTQDDSAENAVLRAELASTKEYLQSINEEREATNEELKASNEEIMSSNEELQSMNEELHTAKEELQSTNEELMTLNDELQNRNRDLTSLGDDLTNLFNSLNSAVILLNKDLKIRKFTPMAEKILRLIPADIGRSVTDIRPNLDIPDLEKVLLEVVATVTPREFEARDPLGKWYSVKVRPYRTNDDRINGIVLLFSDINELKASLIYSQALENTISHPLLVLGGDLIVKRANKKFYDVFKSEPRDTENRFIYQLGNGQWDIPQLRKLLEEILPKNTEFSDFEVKHNFPNIGQKTMRLSACRLFFENKSTETIVLAIDVVDEAQKD